MGIWCTIMYYSDEERLKKLEDQIDKLVKSNNDLMVEAATSRASIRVLRHYLEITVYLLFEEGIMDREDFLHRLNGAQHSDIERDTEETAVYIKSELTKVKEAKHKGYRGFLSKPDIGES